MTLLRNGVDGFPVGAERSLVVTIVAGITYAIVTQSHIKAPAHSWSSRADKPKCRGANRYAG